MGLMGLVLIGQKAKKDERSAIKLQKTPAPVTDAWADQQLLETALKSPESLDEPVSDSNGSKGPEFTPAASSIESVPQPQLPASVETLPVPEPLNEPVNAESLYFWKDYASLRKDAVRNPDSEENGAIIVSIMQARQRRLNPQDL